MHDTLTALTVLALATPALAQDADAPEAPRLMEAEYCFGVAGFIKQLRKFDELDADRRDTVGPVLQMRFLLHEGEAGTMRAELRQDDTVVPIALSQSGDSVESGNLVDILRERGSEVEGGGEGLQMCVVDPAREGRAWNEPGYDLRSGFGIRFIETPGTHTMESLKKGGKDGRKHWKKMAGAMALLVPKFDHIAVATDDPDNPPVVTALKNGVSVGTPEGELYDGARMIDLDDLEDLGADSIRVEATDYRLTPSPDAKTVRRFSGGGDDEDEG